MAVWSAEMTAVVMAEHLVVHLVDAKAAPRAVVMAAQMAVGWADEKAEHLVVQKVVYWAVHLVAATADLTVDC